MKNLGPIDHKFERSGEIGVAVKAFAIIAVAVVFWAIGWTMFQIWHAVMK